MKYFQDWRYLSLMSILFWGLWGFLSKIAGNKLHWGSMLALLCFGTVIVVAVSSPSSFIIKFNRYSLLGLAAGISCALGYYFFYIALQNGTVGTVIPITSMYIVVAVILAFLFLNEPLSIRKMFGILSAILAIYLLSG